ncbi:DUF5709 domain-containing protein [Williamsia sterculiae]|nr:DUF5709 domain-containing protein [Williamsia sterculiae]
MKDDIESTPEGSDGEYSLDQDDQLTEEDTLIDRGVDDFLDEGYTPPDRAPSATSQYGLTAEEQRQGETIDQYLAEEEPDPAAQVSFDLDDEPGSSGEDWRSDEADSDPEFPENDEVGGTRAGRLIDPEEGQRHLEHEQLADDAGIDGGAASAEEAAVHVVDEG